MANFDENDERKASRFVEFYVNTLDNHKDCFKYYLAENAVLDWFGQTVKGCKNIGAFIKANTSMCTHHFEKIKPVATIGFRETHVIKLPKERQVFY